MLLQDTAAPAPDAAAKATVAVPDVKASDLVDKPMDTLEKLYNFVVDWLVREGPGILAALVLLVVAWVVAGTVRRVIVSAMTRAKVDLTLAKFTGNLAKGAIIIFALITVAGTLGISTTGFAAAIGAAGLAIGLALQGNLGNLAAGVLLLVFRPFKIGDSVIVAGQAGIIDGIDLFTTNLDTADNRRIIVPNNAIFSGVIENQTHHAKRRVVVNVPVFAGADIERTRALLTEAASRIARTPGALPDPAPGVALAEVAPAVVWSVAVTSQTPQFLAVREALLVELKGVLSDPMFVPPAPMQQVFVKELPGRQEVR